MSENNSEGDHSDHSGFYLQNLLDAWYCEESSEEEEESEETIALRRLETDNPPAVEDLLTVTKGVFHMQSLRLSLIHI